MEIPNTFHREQLSGGAIVGIGRPVGWAVVFPNREENGFFAFPNLFSANLL